MWSVIFKDMMFNNFDSHDTYLDTWCDEVTNFSWVGVKSFFKLKYVNIDFWQVKKRQVPCNLKCEMWSDCFVKFPSDVID